MQQFIDITTIGIAKTKELVQKMHKLLQLVREEGIEPSTGAWKALALPLRHSRTTIRF